MRTPGPAGQKQRGQSSNVPEDVTSLVALTPPERAKIRILVVDDDRTLRESCATVLEHEGYSVTVASRGDEAIERLKRQPFDIVLADLYMEQIGRASCRERCRYRWAADERIDKDKV